MKERIMTMENRICKVLGIEKPIIQGPMAWAATAPLAGAVSKAGGLGVLGVAFADYDFIRKQIRMVKEMTDKPFGFNAILAKDQKLDQLTELIREEKPPVIHLDGLKDVDGEFAKKYFSIWHEMGLKILVKVFTRQDVETVSKAGADAIIVKGWEGGGINTAQSTMILVPMASAVTDTPIIASGGIVDGRGMAAAFCMGAEAVEMGTRFLASEEVDISAQAKQALLDAGDMATVITGSGTETPCRQLYNNLAKRVLETEATHLQKEAAALVDQMTSGSSKKAFVGGDIENEGAILAGQVVAMIDSIKPVQEIIDEMIAQCEKTLAETKIYK